MLTVTWKRHKRAVTGQARKRAVLCRWCREPTSHPDAVSDHIRCQALEDERYHYANQISAARSSRSG